MSTQNIALTLGINGIFSLVAYFLVNMLIPALSPLFVKANLSGIDMAKADKKRMCVNHKLNV